MTNTKKLAYGVIGLLVLALVYMVGVSATHTFAGAPSGLPSTVQIATTTTVGPQQNIAIFNANPWCSSRIITTGTNPIMLLFADATNGNISSTTLSGIKGHWQAASTTVAYDSGLYGCAKWYGYGYASTTIVLTETN